MIMLPRNHCVLLPYQPVLAKGLGVPCAERLFLPVRRWRGPMLSSLFFPSRVKPLICLSFRIELNSGERKQLTLLNSFVSSIHSAHPVQVLRLQISAGRGKRGFNEYELIFPFLAFMLADTCVIYDSRKSLILASWSVHLFFSLLCRDFVVVGIRQEDSVHLIGGFP